MILAKFYLDASSAIKILQFFIWTDLRPNKNHQNLKISFIFALMGVWVK